MLLSRFDICDSGLCRCHLKTWGCWVEVVTVADVYAEKHVGDSWCRFSHKTKKSNFEHRVRLKKNILYAAWTGTLPWPPVGVHTLYMLCWCMSRGFLWAGVAAFPCHQQSHPQGEASLPLPAPRCCRCARQKIRRLTSIENCPEQNFDTLLIQYLIHYWYNILYIMFVSYCPPLGHTDDLL